MIPGVAGPVEAWVHLVTGRVRLSVDGRELRNQGNNVFTLPGLGGTVVTAWATVGRLDAHPVVRVGDVSYPTGEPTSPLLRALAFLPALLGVFQVIGVMIAAPFLLGTLAIVRSQLGLRTKTTLCTVIGLIPVVAIITMITVNAIRRYSS